MDETEQTISNLFRTRRDIIAKINNSPELTLAEVEHYSLFDEIALLDEKLIANLKTLKTHYELCGDSDKIADVNIFISQIIKSGLIY